MTPEQQVRITEQQGLIVAEVISATLRDPRLGLPAELVAIGMVVAREKLAEHGGDR